jgi:hypothetical protein
MSRSKLVVTAGVLVGWASWALLSVVLLISAKADAAFVGIYIFYMVFGGLVLVASRRDLLSPPGLFTLACFLAFGLNIPLIYLGDRFIETTDITSFVVTDESLFKVMVIVLVAQSGFLLGYLLNILPKVPLKYLLDAPPATRKVSFVAYLLLSGFVIAAGSIRLKFHLGEAGIQSTIPYAGYLQYTFYDGSLLFCTWFVAQSLRQSRLYVFLGSTFFLMLAVTQALLSWRGGIAQVGSIMLGLFWYQVQNDGKNRFSLAWLLVLPLIAGSVMQFGNAIRAEHLGGEAEFAKSTGQLIEHIVYRSQGTTRLAAVADHFGPLTFFNHFFIREIYTKGLTASIYVDRTVYGVAIGQSVGYGTSGPGGPYVAMGLVGVLISYLFLGAFFRCIYGCLVDVDGNVGSIIATVLYSYLIFVLCSLLSETFGIAFIKNMCAVIALLAILKIGIRKRANSVGQGLAGVKWVDQ